MAHLSASKQVIHDIFNLPSFTCLIPQPTVKICYQYGNSQNTGNLTRNWYFHMWGWQHSQLIESSLVLWTVEISPAVQMRAPGTSAEHSLCLLNKDAKSLGMRHVRFHWVYDEIPQSLQPCSYHIVSPVSLKYQHGQHHLLVQMLAGIQRSFTLHTDSCISVNKLYLPLCRVI